MAAPNDTGPAFKPLQPGELSKLVKVWTTATSIRLAWYQAHPVSETVTVFYKKTGSLFGTEITLPTASVLGPELSMRQPPGLGNVQAEYYEVELKKLKPSTAYVVKVRTDGGGAGGERFAVRSDRVLTLSVEEERTRNAEMAAFAGALIRLGDYDASVLTFAPATGLYAVRVLQVDDVAAATQLVRFASEYSDLGLSARTYTLSSIKFGRWGGEISGSRVVGEGELRWIVARAVQLEERSRLEDGYAAQQALLQAESERLSDRLVSERAAAAAALRLTRITHGALAVLLLLLALGAGAMAWRAAAHARVKAGQSLAAAQGEIARLKRQLGVLELYRVSLELDTGAWIHSAAADAASAVTQASEGSCSADGNSSDLVFCSDASNSSDGGAPHLSPCQQRGSSIDSNDNSCSEDGTTSSARWAWADAVPGSRHINDSATLRLLGGPSGGGALLTNVLQRSQKLATLQSRARRHKEQQQQAGHEQEGSAASAQGDAGASQTTNTGRQQQKESEAGSGDVDSSGSRPGPELDLRAAWLSGWGFTDAPPDWSLGGDDGRGIESPDEPPHPWTFVHAASSLYVTYLHEWMKQQLARSMRERVAGLMSLAPEELGDGGEPGYEGFHEGRYSQDAAAAGASAGSHGREDSAASNEGNPRYAAAAGRQKGARDGQVERGRQRRSQQQRATAWWTWGQGGVQDISKSGHTRPQPPRMQGSRQQGRQPARHPGQQVQRGKHRGEMRAVHTWHRSQDQQQWQDPGYQEAYLYDDYEYG